MPVIQFTLTVNEGKWLIAHAIACMPQVRSAMEEGRVVFKAGTTVSCVSQLMLDQPLRICGRITPRGTVSSREDGPAAHSLLYDHGRLENLDNRVEAALLDLGPGDVVITGANLIDSQGDAAMLAGSPGGGSCGRAISALTSEGFEVIVAAGLEKLSPVPVRKALLESRRQGVDSSRGMACGLVPVYGKIVTELEAVALLADVDVCLIARGGIGGAEGGSYSRSREAMKRSPSCKPCWRSAETALWAERPSVWWSVNSPVPAAAGTCPAAIKRPEEKITSIEQVNKSVRYHSAYTILSFPSPQCLPVRMPHAYRQCLCREITLCLMWIKYKTREQNSSVLSFVL